MIFQPLLTLLLLAWAAAALPNAHFIDPTPPAIVAPKPTPLIPAPIESMAGETSCGVIWLENMDRQVLRAGKNCVNVGDVPMKAIQAGRGCSCNVYRTSRCSYDYGDYVGYYYGWYHSDEINNLDGKNAKYYTCTL